MPVVVWIVLFSIIGSVVSLVGGLFLLRRERLPTAFLHGLTAFAAGTLLGTAFLELLPESLEQANRPLLQWTLAGIVGYFFLERSVSFFHLHRHGGEPGHEHHRRATVPLIIIGDTVHNFIDGIVIAGTFRVSIPLGVVTSIAVAAHEIPQEIGDFGILLSKGLSRRRVLLVNIASALATVVAAMFTYTFGESLLALIPAFLALTAGFFIYIAGSDLIPEIRHREPHGPVWIETGLLVLGVLAIEAAGRLTQVG